MVCVISYVYAHEINPAILHSVPALTGIINRSLVFRMQYDNDNKDILTMMNTYLLNEGWL